LISKPDPAQAKNFVTGHFQGFVELHIPEWALEILRYRDSQLEIGQILREALPEITPASLRKHLYLLYLLAIINLRQASAPVTGC
jgi:hypothetical protein